MQTRIFAPEVREILQADMNDFMASDVVHRVVMMRVQHYSGNLLWGYVVYKPNKQSNQEGD